MGDRTPPPRGRAGSAPDFQLTLHVLFRKARDGSRTRVDARNRDGSGTTDGPRRSRDPDRDDADRGQPQASGRQIAAKCRRPGTDRAGPSWPAVIATTVRLSLRRHGARLDGSFRRRRAIALAALALTLLAVGGLTALLARHAVTTAPAAQHQAAGEAALTRPPGSSPGAAGAAAASRAAAAWVARQVSRHAIVACDPGMCPLLHAHGLPAQDLLVLTPAAADPLFANVIVATQAVRALLGSRLHTSYAPTTIASFGWGAARTDVRAIAPDGAAAYQAALSSDWAARRSAAGELVKNPRIHAAGAARQELVTGQVDSRLLITLAALAVSHPVNIAAFGGPAPGASAGVPLREMDISAAGSRAGRSGKLQGIRSFVLGQHPAFRPARVSLVRLPAGRAALRIQFGAPSPIGVLRGTPVTQ